MNEDRRKNLRTQGKYSDDKAQKSRDKKQRSSFKGKDSPETRVPRKDSDGNKSGNNSLVDEDASPLKYEEHSDYRFHQLEEVEKPEEIKCKGEYILSKTNNGESRILYEPQFLSDDEGNSYWDRLHDTVHFDERNIVIHGIEYPQPRLVAWFGPFPYSYSGSTLEPAEMPDVVKEIKGKVESLLASKDIEATFNSVLINLYRDGKDSVSWHSDDELMLGVTPTIASVSLGETRKFEMRPKRKNYDEQSPLNPTCKYYVHLIHGSLIIMTGCMQEDWQHRIPKEYHDKGARINLTFRTVYKLEEAPGHVPVKERNLETAKKPYVRNSSRSSSKYEYKLNDEHFPSLLKDAISVNSNVTRDKNDYTDEKNWDSETSDNEQSAENVETPENTCSVYGKRSENFKPKNKGENNFNNEKPSEKWNNYESKCDYEKSEIEDKTATKKLWGAEYDSSVNGYQENSTVGEKCEMKCNRPVNNSSTGENDESKFYEKIDPRMVHNREPSLTTTNPQQNTLRQEECSAKSYNIKTNSYRSVTQENDMDSLESLNACHNVKSNLWADSLEDSNLDMKAVAKMPLNVEAKGYAISYKNVTQENALDNKMPPNACHYVESNNPWLNSSIENNLGAKQPSKTVLNVDAKVFIPNNIKSSDVSLFSELKLEDLINCDLNSMEGKDLQEHARYLKKQIFDRFHDMSRFNRKDLEFLLEITDGSQTDKNQRLISQQIFRIVENSLIRNRQPANVMSHFDRGSRQQRGYESQTYYMDKGRRYPTQNRNSKFNRNKY